MRIILFIAVFGLLSAYSVFPQWIPVELQVQSDLNAVFFVDSQNGWIVGNDSTILHTDNGGADWALQPSGFSGYDNNYNDVFFRNASLGWIVGGESYGGIILNTTDGGNSWSQQGGEITRRLNTVFFINDTVGWIGGGLEYPGGKIILKTTNGGQIWDTLLIETTPENSIFDIQFVNEDTGWAVGGVYPGWGNIILKTTDGGNNWITLLENYYSEPIASCSFISNQTGWVSFSGPIYNPVGIMKTSTGGNTWNMQYFPDSLLESINTIFFVNDQDGWAAGFTQGIDIESKILYTGNGGLSWEEQNVSTSTVLNSVFFTDAYNGWIAGDNGTVLHTVNGGVPVELSSFTGIYSGGVTVLKWSTSTELNNLGFDIERSCDDSIFALIGFVRGNGTTAKINNYSYVDKTPQKGINYYRLKQIDFDGSYRYCNTIEVNVDLPSKFTLSQNYPNPFNPDTKIKYSVPQASQVQIKIFDVLGNEIETLVNEEKQAGTYEPTWNAASLPSGVYFYQLRAGDPSASSGQVFIQTKKMVLMK